MGGIFTLESLTVGDLLDLKGCYLIDSDRGLLKKVRSSYGHLSVNVIDS
jgi:hypothetical protein